MRFYFLVFLFLSAAGLNSAFSQQSFFFIKGRVADSSNGNPMPFASVAAQNTTIGTLTDSSGNFQMRLPEGGYTITISFTGYEPQNFRVNGASASDSLIVSLVPETKSLEEVSIPLDIEVKDGWKKYGEFFLQNFIGQSDFSNECVIRNPSALHFYFYKKRNVLKVLAREPVIIDNFALGYVLKFSLDSLINDYNDKTCSYIGYPVFEEMQGTNRQKQIWEKNRNRIYYGSLLHFMRSLYDKTLDQEGFEINLVTKTQSTIIPSAKEAPYTEILRYETDSAGVVAIDPVQNEVNIIYQKGRPGADYLSVNPNSNKDFQISTLVFDNEPTFIEKNGYYYPQEEMMTYGYLGFKKIGDMLPYDYQPLTVKKP